MVKLIESTTFKDPERSPVMVEKTFDSMRHLIKTLKKSAISNEIRYKLTKFKECYIDYDGARTILKIVDE